MREILFKAKEIKSGKWVYGYYKKVYDMHFIDNPGSEGNFYQHIVDKNTICQYTGLTDKNGNKIWENDILEWEFANVPSDYYECVWLDDECAFAFKNGNDYTNPVDCWDEYSDHFCMKVIGSIFDNPELLKGE